MSNLVFWNNKKKILKWYLLKFLPSMLASLATKMYFSLQGLTLVLLNPDIPCLCKQCWSRSDGFWRSQLIWICTVCHQVCEFIATIQIKLSDWLKIQSGHGILICSAGQGLNSAFDMGKDFIFLLTSNIWGPVLIWWNSILIISLSHFYSQLVLQCYKMDGPL